MIFKLKNDEKDETPVELWLERKGEDVVLKARKAPGLAWDILTVAAMTKKIFRFASVGQELGFEVDEVGRVEIGT